MFVHAFISRPDPGCAAVFPNENCIVLINDENRDGGSGGGRTECFWCCLNKRNDAFADAIWCMFQQEPDAMCLMLYLFAYCGVNRNNTIDVI